MSDGEILTEKALRNKVSEFFGDPKKANTWLSINLSVFNGISANDLIKQGELERVESVIDKLAHGIVL